MAETTAKILTVIGTRPEAIKLAPVVRALNEHLSFESRVCVTAQHREMLDQVLELFGIEPDHDLDLMKDNQNLFEVTSRALAGLEAVFGHEQPDLVLAQGDTTTVLVASLAAFYLRIPFAHVEAGLRTEDKYFPFPEEMNRRLADTMADLCFASTEHARQNLIKEGVQADRIFVTGNTVVDALQAIRSTQASEATQREFEKLFAQRYGVVLDRRMILVTGHRRESFGSGFEGICQGLRRLAEDYEDIRIVYPVHLNPNVQEPVHRLLSGLDRVHLIEPLGYASFVWLLSRCHFVVTDSGGIQEEAPSFGKPVLILRKETERVEGVEAGIARLVGTDSESIYQEARRLLDNPEIYEEMAQAVNPYGDGQAAQRIVKILEHRLVRQIV
jgi:UDP-N-acetylglucosamine 2-epimerase (non-hydrolysing)